MALMTPMTMKTWGIIWGMSGACLWHHLGHVLGIIWGIMWACLGHVWGIIWGMSWVCLKHHLGHVWGIIWGMSVASSGECLWHHLGHIWGLKHHLGHVWGILWGMSGALSGACFFTHFHLCSSTFIHFIHQVVGKLLASGHGWSRSVSDHHRIIWNKAISGGTGWMDGWDGYIEHYVCYEHLTMLIMPST